MKKTVFSVLLTMLLAHSAGACPNGTETKEGAIWRDKPVCVIDGAKGRYVTDIELINEYSYHLKGGVFFGNDNEFNVTLTIQPGVVIAGGTGADFLVITRGSKIHAKGTATHPIVFTTYVDEPQRGSWGGVILNGRAPINCERPNSQGFCEAEGEGHTGVYGGRDPMDSSGVLKYVRVEWAGYEITRKNELNGIAFQGVGAKTLVDFVQVHQNLDDGIEFFGGTVNVKHVYLTGNGDDSLDWTSGWTGKAQFVFVRQASDEGENGIEADNLDSPMNAQPRSNPTLSNATFIGSMTALGEGVGIHLRRGTGVRLYNSVIKGFRRGGIDIDHRETFRSGHADRGGLPGIHMANTVFDNEINFVVDEGEEDIREWILEGMDMDALFDLEPVREESLVLQEDLSVAVGVSAVMPEDEAGFFEQVDYIGAFRPGGDNWAAGWTVD